MSHRPIMLAVVATVVLPAILLVLGACSAPAPSLPAPETVKPPAGWRAELDEVRAERQAGLEDPEGWRALVGLDWLEPGETTVGSALDQDVVLPTINAPPFLGTFRVSEEGTVTFLPAPEVAVKVAGEPVVGPLPVRTDAEEDTTFLEVGPLVLHVLRRGEQLALRTRDRAAPWLTDPPELTFFPLREEWYLQARFEPHETPRTIPVLDVTGVVRDFESPGSLVFPVPGSEGGATHRLDVLDGGEVDGEPAFFVIFGDTTNGEETYPAGRYLYVTRPREPGAPVTVDFNRAYNPPCAFTAFATCPLPPPGNKLAVAIAAGEQYDKSYGGWNHGHEGADETGVAE